MPKRRIRIKNGKTDDGPTAPQLPPPIYTIGIQKGFTLAELLIALAILGVIATFTIPKLLNTQSDQNRKAVYKETLAAVQANLYAAVQRKEIYPGNHWPASLAGRFNSVKLCGNSLTGGCWTQSIDGGPNDGSSSDQRGQVGMILHNGATLAGIDDGTADGGQPEFDIYLDWNGAAGPNLMGEDQMALGVNVTSGPRNGVQPGGYIFYNTATRTLYQTIFSN